MKQPTMRTLIEDRNSLKKQLKAANTTLLKQASAINDARRARSELTQSRNECLVALAKARDHIEAIELILPTPDGMAALAAIQQTIQEHR